MAVYQFKGAAANDNSGYSVSSAGDVDGDGRNDLIIGAPAASGGSFSGASYLISAADLVAADIADGTVDWIIDLGNVAAQSTSYQFNGGVGGFSGVSVSSAGDVDGDGKADLLIGAFNASGGGASSGETYLMTAADLAAADLADGTADGVIDLGNVGVQSSSYQFNGTAAGDRAGWSVSSAGDIDGDGKADLLIGAINGGVAGAGESYLITAANLATADAADGTDGIIDLGNVAAQSTSYQFTGTAAGDQAGATVASAGDVDGDGLDDLIIGASNATGTGLSYLITAADLALADAVDGTDGIIDLGNVAAQSTSYAFVGGAVGDAANVVSSAGDVDGDGLVDLIIGASGAGVGGASYLISAVDLAAADLADGTSDGVIDLGNVATQSTSYQFVGAAAGDQAGYSVASAGDIDGDGMADLIIGAKNADGGGADSGESYLITAADLTLADTADGTTDGIINLGNVAAQSASYQFIGAATGDSAGVSVSSAGDVDADGLDDLIIGAAGANGNAGESYLITAASLTTLDAADGTTDGVIDLANVHAPPPVAPPVPTTSYQFIGATAGDSSGASVSSAGDVDGDGYDDLLIGAPAADTGGTNSGDSYLISGADLAAADAADGSVDAVIDLSNVSAQSGSYQFLGQTNYGKFGTSVSSAGDVDGDGQSDLFIGAPSSGRSVLITASNLASADAADGVVDGVIDFGVAGALSAAYTFVEAVNNDDAGISVSSAGDMDGDGLSDLIIGAYHSDIIGFFSGGSYLVSAADLAAADLADGTTDGVINLGNISALSSSYEFVGVAVGDQAGVSVSSAGDVDGDGLADLIVGANLADINGTSSGSSYLITAADLALADAADGSADGVISLGNVAAQSASYEFVGASAYDKSGFSVSSAGDVDGDGLDDLIIGAPQAYSSGAITGEIFLVTAADLAAADVADGSSDGVIDLGNVAAQSTSYQFIGAASGDFSGSSVSSAGDVDGDGLADLLIGAYSSDFGGTDSGASYLMTAADLALADAADGSVDGVVDLGNVAAQSTSYAFIGAAAGDGAGVSVSSAGDVDADGLADLLIGANDANGNAGESYLITAANLTTLDAADGTTDGVIDLGNVFTPPIPVVSYQFIGAAAGDGAGTDVSSAGDVDGDGQVDLLIGAPGAAIGGPLSGQGYLVTAANLAAADAADGQVDSVIDLANVAAQSTSYQFNGVANSYSGFSIASAGDVDGDGRDDLIIGAPAAAGGGLDSGESYLITAADLVAADTADGAVDGVIELGNISAQSTSYQFTGGAGGFSGVSVSSAGDVDGDGKADLLIGALNASGGGALSGESYLMTAADLAAADLADGTTDGVISLGNVAAQSSSYQFNGGASAESGVSVTSAGDVDGDGLDDLLIGAFNASGGSASTGESFLITAADLTAADLADGTTDGVIDLSTVGAQSTSYQFVGANAGDVATFVASAGDVDGDGLADLLIGAPGAGGSGGGYLITAANLALADAVDGTDGVINLANVAAQSTSYEFVGGAAADQAGYSVASAGDVDGDGLADVFIGANFADGGGVDSGASYLITASDLAAVDALDGTTDGVIDLSLAHATSNSYQFIGAAVGDGSGYSVASAGDIDKDGLDDLLIGAANADGGGLDSGESYLITAAEFASLDAADGLVDHIIDLNYIDPPSFSYKFVGSVAGFNGEFGYSVSSAGDYTGDGLDDLIVGDPGGALAGTFAGQSYLIASSDLTAADAADGVVDGMINVGLISQQTDSYILPGYIDGSGYSVSSAGDVNGDGLDDILIGAPAYAGINTGSAYLVSAADLPTLDAASFGGANGMVSLSQIAFGAAVGSTYQFYDASSSGPSIAKGLGVSVSSAGDVDGDGLADLLIGAELADGGGVDSGASYLITSADLAAADLADGTVDGRIDIANVAAQSGSYEFIGAAAGDHTSTVSSAGDVDGDGLDDLIIGSQLADGIGPDSGASYLITAANFAAADLADGVADGVINLGNVAVQSSSYQFDGGGADDRAGYSVSSAGDVDGDGKADLFVGANRVDSGGNNSGEAYLINASDLAAADLADGTADGVIDLGNVAAQTNSYQFTGTEALDFAGTSISSAGDTDGDGKADLLIGAPRADGGGSNSGEIYLITSSDLAAADAADGTVDGVIDLDFVNEQTTSYQIIGASKLDFAGFSVASAGDIDGDGLDDLLIGAYAAGVGESYLLVASDFARADGADGTVDGVIHLSDIYCFVAGMRVLTPSGEVAIEDLEVGQMVITKDRGPQPLRWIGTSTHQAMGALAPIRFRKGCIGNHRDLLVSPQHRMLVSGWQAEVLFGEREMLVSAVSLVNDSTIMRIEGGEVTYVHLLFDQHEIVFAEGAPSESFHPGEADLSTMAQAAKAEIYHLFPELELQNEAGYGGPVRTVINAHEAELLHFE